MTINQLLQSFYQPTVQDVVNAFCPTGEGGGVDASCSPAGGSGLKQLSAMGRKEVLASSDESVQKVIASLKAMTKEKVYAEIADAYGKDYADAIKTVSKGSKTRMIDEVHRRIKEQKEAARFNERKD